LIGLDTNVLVRYLVQDDDDQSARATRFMERLDEDDQGFVSLVALVELHWVLRRAYKVDRQDAVAIIRALLDARELSLQEPDIVRRALSRMSDETDFSDALIGELGAAASCTYTATFDEGTTSLSAMRLVP